MLCHTISLVDDHKMEGLHKHVPKADIYLPMGFALRVEVRQMRCEHNRRRRVDGTSD